MNKFKTIQEIENVIYDMNYFNHWQLNYGLSMPVIRQIENQYYVAYYVIRNGPEVIHSGMSTRPEFWILYNLEEGSCLMKDCKTDDFIEGYSDFDKLYKLEAVHLDPTDMESKTIDINSFDAFLKESLKKETLKSYAYKQYIKNIKACVGNDFAVFYDYLTS